VQNINKYTVSVSISASGQYQTLVSQNDKIYISSNFGVTWMPKNLIRSWTAVSVSASGQYQTALAFDNTASMSYTLRSNDFGNNWTSVQNLGWANSASVSISASGQYQTIVFKNSKIYISSDFGKTWIDTENSRLWVSVSVSASGQYQTAVCDNGYIYISIAGPTFGNLTVSEGNILAIPNYPNVESTLNQLTAYTDDFIDGLNNNPIQWVSNDSVQHLNDEIGHRGIVRLSDNRYLYPIRQANRFYWQDFKRMDFLIRCNFATSTTYSIGLHSGTTEIWSHMLFVYQNSQWYIKGKKAAGTNYGGEVNELLPISVSMSSGDWMYGAIIKTGVSATSLRIYFKNTNTGIVFDTTYSTGSLSNCIHLLGEDNRGDYRPFFKMVGSGYSLDIDYVSIEYTTDTTLNRPL
jgi:hypothetical protein